MENSEMKIAESKSTMEQWKILRCSLYEVNLDLILASGQSFRWIKHENGIWMGMLSNTLWKLKQECDGNIKYCVREAETPATKNVKRPKTTKCDSAVSRNSLQIDREKALCNYLQLDVHVGELYARWSKKNQKFQEVSEKYQGIRILRQDPIENLFSFICSSNNNISRITSMVDKLCKSFGDPVLEDCGICHYSFPTVESLAEDNVEKHLRDLGFGYRAKFISQTAKSLHRNMSKDWLYSLRKLDYQQAHDALLQLPGVGSKVADCVCLMSLDKPEAVPVDTHVWKITKAYLPHLKSKTLTNKIYKEVGDFYRQEFGEYAGWAQSVLFCSDLKKIKNQFSTTVV